jgi:feruloyl esterase
MNKLTGSQLSILAVCLLALAMMASAATADDCQDLSAIDLPDVTVEAVDEVEKPVAHCKLEGRVGPTIRFALLLPKEWNGGFVMGGGGGFVGSIDNQALSVGALTSGYATAGTDTGHQAAA